MLLVGNRVWTHCWGEEVKVWKTMAPDQIQNILAELEQSVRIKLRPLWARNAKFLVELRLRKRAIFNIALVA